MRREEKGSFTIEASVIVPIILMVVVLIIYVIFYYHDKNILAGAAYETAAAGCERDGYETYKEEEIRAYFQRRIRGKLILFSDVQEEVEVTRREVTVYCTGTKKRMKVSVKASAVRTEPEAFIRKIRKIQKAGEKLGETK